GGMSGGMNQMMSKMRAYEIIFIIQQTIDPDSWFDAGGEGRINEFSGSQFIVWQTPEVHEKVRGFLEKMREQIGRQVAIETRFLLVDENFLEDIGLDVDITKLGLNRHWSGGLINDQIMQDSYTIVRPQATGISSSLGGLALSALGGGTTFGDPLSFSYSSGDDLTIQFMVRATQAHSNSKVLTAPHVTVLSGETAAITVDKERNYINNSTINTESIAVPGSDNVGVNATIENDIDTLDTGITMYVTPTITSDKKYVLLNISANHSDELTNAGATNTTYLPDGRTATTSFELPLTETTDINTRVLIPDQGTVILGGLTLTSEREVEAGVPVLSKIPILGRFFSNRSEVKDKQILLILVKPTIVLKDEVEQRAVAALEGAS
ncbi:MAG: type II and III secretion system protein, partial [Planctomycetes bacterium]|nr:type II and III secretion system protein [Planctomycetota bacterium]